MIPIAPMLTALITGVVCLVTRRWPRIQKAISLSGGLGVLAATLLVAERAREEILVYAVGGDLFVDGVPFGILLEIDQLSAFMMVFSAFVMLVSLVYSVFFISERGQKVSYHGLWHFLGAGVMGAFSTGDLFNLFVWFEVLLLSSYILVVFYSNAETTRSALYYVAINLVGSSIMLLAIGGIYASVGTLNLADIAHRVTTGGEGVNLNALYGLSSLLFVAFVLKAGAVPFHFWAPEAYKAAPAPVSAVLAGVVKKVGVYGAIRIFITVLGAPLGGFYWKVILVIALVSTIYGGWAALSRDNLVDVLSYSSVAQVGFIFFGVGAGANPSLPYEVRVIAVAAALVYALNHALIKSTLFLIAGHVSNTAFTTRFESLGGIVKKAPVMSFSFLFCSIALIGVPPFNGFFGKLLVFDTGVKALNSSVGNGTGLGTAILAGGIAGAGFTILYLSRAWSLAFWSEKGDVVEGVNEPSAGILVPILVLVAACFLVGIGFEPILEYAKGAAEAALDTRGYSDAVLSEARNASGAIREGVVGLGSRTELGTGVIR